MPQIAGFRGALWEPSKVELAKVASQPIDDVPGRLTRGELSRDSTRAVYRYHQTFTHQGRRQTRKAMICAIELVPWTTGTVRPHEAVDPAAREAALRGIKAAGGHTEAVLAGYRDAPGEVDRLLRNSENERPALDVTTADGTQHRLWRVSSAEVIGKLRPLFAPKKLHVLDGHARYEAMLAYQAELAQRTQLLTYSSANFGLACLVNLADPSIVVAPRHRVVRGDNVKRDAVLEAAKRWFIVEKLAGAAKDPVKQQAALADTVAHQPAFVAVFAGDADAWKLTLSPDVSPTFEGVQIHRALQKYDPIAVEHMFLGRAVPGTQTHTETRVADVLAQVAAGAPLGIVMRPLSIEQILHADELGQVVPFGSTAFEPALANLVVQLVDPDEDLV
ncbi:MAG: hypothetical protein JWO36_4832 [Myxococcales bacterium]|nr:hypothetical protein [Myxococcales bacterium]